MVRKIRWKKYLTRNPVTDTLREKVSCVEVRSRRQIKEEERNMWRGNNPINNGRKLLELKKVMRP